MSDMGNVRASVSTWKTAIDALTGKNRKNAYIQQYANQMGDQVVCILKLYVQDGDATGITNFIAN